MLCRSPPHPVPSTQPPSSASYVPLPHPKSVQLDIPLTTSSHFHCPTNQHTHTPSLHNFKLLPTWIGNTIPGIVVVATLIYLAQHWIAISNCACTCLHCPGPCLLSVTVCVCVCVHVMSEYSAQELSSSGPRIFLEFYKRWIIFLIIFRVAFLAAARTRLHSVLSEGAHPSWKLILCFFIFFNSLDNII